MYVCVCVCVCVCVSEWRSIHRREARAGGEEGHRRLLEVKVTVPPLVPPWVPWPCRGLGGTLRLQVASGSALVEKGGEVGTRGATQCQV